MLKTTCPFCKREVYLCDRIHGSRLVLDPSVKVYSPTIRTMFDKTAEDAIETTLHLASHAAVCRGTTKKS